MAKVFKITGLQSDAERRRKRKNADRLESAVVTFGILFIAVLGILGIIYGVFYA